MSRAALVSPRPARRRIRLAAALVFLALFCVGFILLGNWQVRRLHWKLGLIHDVAVRVHAKPVAAPGPADWPRIAHGHLQYLHVRLHGRFLPDKQILVHGTSDLGYGYWVMAPLHTRQGFIVLVNRGYVPADAPESPGLAKLAAPAGEVELTGLLRLTEPKGGFLRPNEPARGRWYSRDVAALAQTDGLAHARVAPYFVDAAAGADPHQFPVGGLTKIHFRNQHLQYAITWYALALGMVLAAAVVLRHERRPGD